MAPRLEVDLDKILHNTYSLVNLLAKRAISITGVTKATLGSPEIAGAFVRGGIKSLGDSRIENIEKMCNSNIPALMNLIRSPMISQVDRAVTHTEVSLNSELAIIKQLSLAAKKLNRTHKVILMVEFGDLREGIMPGNLEEIVRQTLGQPNIILHGIGTNLACQNGVSPDKQNMSELSVLANTIESKFDLSLAVVSGGNSANLNWALAAKDTGRINELRLGESILLGRETLYRTPIEGLHIDAFTLVAEVIEAVHKPSQPWGKISQTAFGEKPKPSMHLREPQIILAIGRQDVDLLGLYPPAGITILGASSDHLIISSKKDGFTVGSEIKFQLNYSALMRAMTSPFVSKVFNTTK